MEHVFFQGRKEGPVGWDKIVRHGMQQILAKVAGKNKSVQRFSFKDLICRVKFATWVVLAASSDRSLPQVLEVVGAAIAGPGETSPPLRPAPILACNAQRCFTNSVQEQQVGNRINFSFHTLRPPPPLPWANQCNLLGVQYSRCN